MDNKWTIYTQPPYFSERRDVKLLDYSEKSTASCPTACTNRNCKTCYVLDDVMV